MRAFCSLAVFALLLTAGLQEAARAEERAPDVQFHDDLDWLLRTRWYVSDGWTNGAHQNCTWSARAVSIRDGVLQMAFKAGPKGGPAWICAEVQSRARYGFGTFEARIRVQAGSGRNAALFTYIGPVHDRPHHEIDVEILTRDPGNVALNSYVDGRTAHGATVPLPAPADTAFHTYAFTARPGWLGWYVDGVLVHEASGDALPEMPQHLYLSHWGTETLTDWMGPFDPPTEPAVMEVDWVAFTPWGTPCAFAESTLCRLEAP